MFNSKSFATILQTSLSILNTSFSPQSQSSCTSRIPFPHVGACADDAGKLFKQRSGFSKSITFASSLEQSEKSTMLLFSLKIYKGDLSNINSCVSNFNKLYKCEI